MVLPKYKWLEVSFCVMALGALGAAVPLFLGTALPFLMRRGLQLNPQADVTGAAVVGGLFGVCAGIYVFVAGFYLNAIRLDASSLRYSPIHRHGDGPQMLVAGLVVLSNLAGFLGLGLFAAGQSWAVSLPLASVILMAASFYYVRKNAFASSIAKKDIVSIEGKPSPGWGHWFFCFVRLRDGAVVKCGSVYEHEIQKIKEWRSSV